MEVNCSVSTTFMFCGNVNEVNCVLCIAFHGVVQCSLSRLSGRRLSGRRANPLFGILAENDIQATSCIAFGRRWSTVFATFSAHVSFRRLVSHVSRGDGPSCAGTSLWVVVTIDEFKRTARRTLRITTPFHRSSSGRSSVFLKAHHDH